jgi:hypothetical protein
MATYPLALTLTNPGAETGDATGWSSLFGSGPKISSGSARTGTYRFVGSADQEEAMWGQTITVPAAVETDIDNGRIEMLAEVYLNSFSSDTDSVCLIVDCFTSGDVYLGAVWNDLKNLDSWTLETISMWVPPTTRKIRIGARSLRITGTEASGWLDDFAITLSNRQAGYSHVNCFANDGSTTTGVTNVTNTAVTTGITYGETGIRWVNGVDNTGDSYFGYTIPAADEGLVDAGRTSCRFHGSRASFNEATNNDQGRSYIEFRNSGGTLIGSRINSDVSDISAIHNIESLFMEEDVPALTRSIRFGMSGTRVSGTVGTIDFRHLRMVGQFSKRLVGAGLRPTTLVVGT